MQDRVLRGRSTGGAPAAHARTHLVDGVPPEDRQDRRDLLQTVVPVERPLPRRAPDGCGATRPARLVQRPQPWTGRAQTGVVTKARFDRGQGLREPSEVGVQLGHELPGSSNLLNAQLNARSSAAVASRSVSAGRTGRRSTVAKSCRRAVSPPARPSRRATRRRPEAAGRADGSEPRPNRGTPAARAPRRGTTQLQRAAEQAVYRRPPAAPARRAERPRFRLGQQQSRARACWPRGRPR